LLQKSQVCKENNSATARTIPRLGAWIAVVLFCAHQGLAQTPASKSAGGRRTFETICASCHGLNGRGGERGPDIATRPEIVRLSDSQLLKILHDGKPQAGMPPFASLGATKLSELLDHLRTLQGKRSAPPITANPENGKQLFSGKAGCAQCHMIKGAGGFIGPDLSDYGASHSVDDIRNSVLNADKRLGFRKNLAHATTKDGKQFSGIIRNEDNFSVQLQALDGTFHLLDKSTVSAFTLEPSPLMPNYDSKLSPTELDEIVAYILSVADAKPNQQKVIKKHQ